MMMSISSSSIPKALYSSPLPFLSGQSSIVSSRSSLTGVWRQCRITSTKSLVCSKKPPSSSTLIRCAGAVREINEGEFSDVVLKSERPVLVEFVASWCGPCRLIAPAVQSLAQEYEDRLMIVKVDHDSNLELIKEYKVYGLPALILFRNGQEVPESRREGAITIAKLKDYVDKLLESVSTV